MGVVYSPESVAFGNIPAANGLDHLGAAHLFYDSLTSPEVPTHDNVRLLMLGSVATGQSNRRSDIDFFLVRTPLGGVDGVQQQLHIRSALQAAQRRHHVRFEGQQFTEQDLRIYGSKIGDPLWMAHCVGVQDNYPQ